MLWQGVRGMADLESGTPISPDTLFDVGSVSKQFTATAVLLLANQGKLSTSDPLSKHLTGLPSWSRTVTLGQLMHHVSGIPEYLKLLEARGLTRFPFEEKISRKLELKVISEVEFLDFKPGSKWQYSNSNYLLLGTVVEKLSGQQLPEFLQRNIFGPLQLHMVAGSTRALPDKARSYRVSAGGSGYEIADWHWDTFGAAGIQSTPSTLVRWADNYRSGRLGGSQLLKAQLRGAEPTGEDAIGHEGTRYGAGIISDSDGTLWHNGEYSGFHTEFSVLPGLQRAVVVSCNLFDTDAAALSESLTEIWRTT